MAHEKKRKLCKLQSMEESSLREKQPTHIRTGKLLEILNAKRRSLQKILRHKNASLDPNVFDDREVDQLQYFHEAPTTCNIGSLRKYAAPVKSVSNSLAGESSRPFRKMIVRDESPEVEEIHGPFGSSSSDANRSLQSSFEVGFFPKNNLPTESVLDIPVSNEPRVEQNVEETEKEPQVTDAASMEEPQGLKQKRGPTKLKNIAIEPSSRIEVNFNTMGQAVGKGSVSLSSFLGPLVREMVPVTIDDWRKLDKPLKEVLWKSVQVRYNLEKEWEKAYVFKLMANIWRASKSRLVRQIIEAPNEAERLKLRPDNIKSEVVWKAFVRKKLSSEFKVKSEKFKAMKKKQLPHTSSRKGYARLIDDMSKAGASKESVRVNAWVTAHKKRNGEPVSAVAGEAIENMEEIQKELPLSSKTNVQEDAVSKVLGPEKNGRVRAFGNGVTITKLAIVSERDELILRLENECRKLKEQSITMQGFINTLLESQGSSCQAKKQSNETVPFPLSSNTNSQSIKCKVMDWSGSGEIVAEGIWSSCDPKALVHHIPLGPGAVRVWVDVARKPEAFLWRPTSQMTLIEEAVGSTIAWPIDKVIRN